MDAVLTEQSALTVALFGYRQHSFARQAVASADNVIALSEPYAAHAHCVSSQGAQVALIEADRHAVIGRDEYILFACRLEHGDERIALVKDYRAQTVRADVLQRRLLHALYRAALRDKDKIAVVIPAAAADHRAYLLAVLGLDNVYDVRAARIASGLGDVVALLYEHAPLRGEEKDIVMRGGGEHRVHKVLVLRRHRADAAAAAPLSAVLADGHALDIPAVGKGIDALLLFDEVFDVYLVRDVLYLGNSVVAVLVAQGDELVLEYSLYLLGVCQQILEVMYLVLKLLVLVFELLAVEPLERDKAHVAYGLSLNVAEIEALHKALLCVVIAGADNADDLVDIVLSYQQAFQQMRPLLGLAQVVPCAPDDYILLESEVLVKYMAQGEYLRLGLIVHQRQHIYRECGLHRRLRKETVQHYLRVRVALELDDDAHTVAVGLIAQVGYAIKALVMHLIRNVLYELALIDLIRQLCHDYPRASLAVLLKLGARTHNDLAAPGGVGLTDAAAPHDYPARRKVRPGDMLHEVGERRLRVLQYAHAGVYDLFEVVRRDVRRHADGDTGRAVHQQVREA